MNAAMREQVLADLRRTHAQLKKSPGPQNLNVSAWSMRLTLEEVDVLLAIVDERDDLKRGRRAADIEPGSASDTALGAPGREAREAPPTVRDCKTCGRKVIALGREGRHGWTHRNGMAGAYHDAEPIA